MEKPTIVERFADNGEHSHWELVDTETSVVLWTESEEGENPCPHWLTPTKRVVIRKIWDSHGTVSDNRHIEAIRLLIKYAEEVYYKIGLKKAKELFDKFCQ